MSEVHKKLTTQEAKSGSGAGMLAAFLGISPAEVKGVSLDKVPSYIYAHTLQSGWAFSNPTYTADDYKWSLKWIYKDFTKTNGDLVDLGFLDSAGFTQVKKTGVADLDRWNMIIKSMGKQIIAKDPKKISSLEFSWFLTFYQFKGKEFGIPQGVSLEESGIDGKELADFYWKAILSQKEGSGVTKLLGKMSYEDYSKALKSNVDKYMKSGDVNASFSPVIMDLGSEFGLTTVNPTISRESGGTVSGWFFGTTKSITKQTYKNPIYAEVPGITFGKRKWGELNAKKINKQFKPALETGLKSLKTLEGTQGLIFPKPANYKSGGGPVTGYEFKKVKDPNGLPANVANLRDLPTGDGPNKKLYDAIEHQIQASYVEMLDTFDYTQIKFERAKHAGENLTKFYQGATQYQSWNKSVDACSRIIANLFISTQLRSVIAIFWDKFADQAKEIEKDNQPLSQEALDKANKLSAEAMSSAQSEAAKKLNAGLADANAAAAAAADVDRLTEDEIDEKRKYLKQCALITNYGLLKKKYHDKIQAGGGALKYFKGSPQSPEPRFIMVNTHGNTGNKRNIINQLVTPKYTDISPFMKLTPDLASALTPKIRVFKLWNSGRCELKEQEFPFLHYEDPKQIDMLKEFKGIDRGRGAGIKSLSFTFEGTNPAEARSAIGVEMTLFFQSFDELVKLRDGSGGKWKYVEMILHPHDSVAKEKIKPQHHLHNPYEYGDVSNYRIRLDLGWQKIEGHQKEIFNKRAQKIDGLTADSLNKAITRINKSYYLVMVDHEFDLKENGNLELKVNFRAYIETALQDKKLDALSSPMIIAHRNNFGKELGKLLAEKTCTMEQYRELRATYAAIEDEFRLASYRSIMKRMQARGHIHFCEIDRSDVGPGFKLRGGKIFEKPPKLKFSNDGSFNTNKKGDGTEKPEPSTKEKAKASVKDQAEKAIKAKVEKKVEAGLNVEKKKDDEMPSTRTFTQLPTLEDQENGVSFFMLGDLLHTILDCMYEPAKNIGDGTDPDIFDKLDSDENQEVGDRMCHLKNTTILIPSFELTSPEEGQENELISMNIAEIPVSVDYFFEFMTQKVIKGKRKTYPVMNMLRDLSREIVINILSERCMDLRSVKKIAFAHTAFVGVNKSGDKDPLVELMKGGSYSNGIYLWSDTAYKNGKLPIPAVESHMSSKDFRNYLVLFPKSGTDHHQGNGLFEKDVEQGVYHFEIGANQGILKKIKFSKTDMQYLREARFLQQGNDGLLQLGAVYKATLEMIGNTLYYPGMNIWIEPTSLGNGSNMDPRVGGKNRSAANALGFGGYHMVIRVQGTISSGKFSTTVEAQFTSSGDGSTNVVKPKNSPIKGADKKGPSGNIEANEDRLATSDPETGETQQSEEFTRCNEAINLRQQQLQSLYSKLTEGMDSVNITGGIAAAAGLPAVDAAGASPTTTTATSTQAKTETPPEAIKGAKKYVITEVGQSKYVWDGKAENFVQPHWEKDGVLYTKEGNIIEAESPPEGKLPPDNVQNPALGQSEA